MPCGNSTLLTLKGTQTLLRKTKVDHAVSTADCCPTCDASYLGNIVTPRFEIRKVFEYTAEDRSTWKNTYYLDRWEWTAGACTPYAEGTAYTPPGAGSWAKTGYSTIAVDYNNDCIREHVGLGFRCNRVFIFRDAWHDGCKYRFDKMHAPIILRTGPHGTSAPHVYPFEFQRCVKNSGGKFLPFPGSIPKLYFDKWIRNDSADHSDLTFEGDALNNKLLTTEVIRSGIAPGPECKHMLILAVSVYWWVHRQTVFSGGTGYPDCGSTTVSHLLGQDFATTVASVWVNKLNDCIELPA